MILPLVLAWLLAQLAAVARAGGGYRPVGADGHGSYSARRRFERHQRRRREVRLRKPAGYQLCVLHSRARRKVLAAGRRWGKSTTAMTACLAGHGPQVRRYRPGPDGKPQAWVGPKFLGALHGGNVWWVVPDYRTSGRARWRDLKRACRGAYTYKNETEMRLEFPGGGSIEVRSADDPDSLRGEGLDGAVVDEAAFMPEVVWTEALRAALSDRRGWCIFISTPAGRDSWFYGVWLRGAPDELLAELKLDPAEVRRAGWESWQRPSAENPLLTVDELEDARADLGGLLFAQEYLAQFIVVGGGVIARATFRYYDLVAGGTAVQLEADTPRTVQLAACLKVAYADLAVTTKSSSDYTVVGTFAITDRRELILLDLWRGRVEGPDLVPTLRSVYFKMRPARLKVERTAFQVSVVQAAGREGLPVAPLDADRDKTARALMAAAALERGAVYFPRWAPWLADLEAELEGFPAADHDDQVDVLGYAAVDLVEGDLAVMVQH